MNNLRTSLILFFTCLTLSGFNQDLIWAKKIGGTGDVLPLKSITDSQNNIYLIGSYSGNISQDTYSFNSKGGSQDFFVVKYDKEGTLVWLNTFGSIGTDDVWGIGLSPDESSLYIVGYFQYDCYYTPTDFISVSGTANATNEDALFASLNPLNGNVSSFKRLAWDTFTSSSQRVRGLKVTPDNKLVIFGTFKNEIVLSNTTLTDASGKTQNFIAKINLDGSAVWLKHIIGTGISAQNTTLYSLDISPSGYYFAGYYQNNLQFDLGTISSTSGSVDFFLYKTNLNGEGLFLRKVSGSNNEFCTSVSVDENDNVFVGGYTNTISGGINVDSTGTLLSPIVSTKHPNSKGNFDLLFAKFNSTGTLQWFNAGGSIGVDGIYRAIGKNGLFIVAGKTGGAFSFNGNPISFSGGTSDGLGLIYDKGDNLVYAINIGGIGNDVGETATIDNDGNYIIIGDYTSNPLTIGGINLSNSGFKDVFLAKYRKGSLDASSTNITCYGSANGTITVTPRGPLSLPFTYNWKMGTEVINPEDPQYLTGLSAGTYTLNFFDSEGFTIDKTFTITEPNYPLSLLNISQTNVNCFGNATGSVMVSPSGGTYPYSYNKNGGSYSTSQTFSGLRAGEYTFGVKDTRGCLSTLVVTISEPLAPISLSLSGTDNSATATPAGGTSPYSYNWNTSPVQTVQTVVGLSAGTYTATVTDSKGCSVSKSIGISLITATTTKEDIKCFGDGNTGTATVTAFGGTGNYSYSWNTTPIQITQQATGLSAGTYTVTVTDDATPTPNSTATSVTIQEPEKLTASLTKTEITCRNNQDGSIQVVLSGGTAPFTCAWTKNTSVFASTLDIFNLGSGDYELTVTDKSGCNDVKSMSISSTPQSNLTISLNAVNAKCAYGQGNISGSITSSVNGASGAYTYLWNNGKTTSSITGNPANYSLTVEDALKCKASATATINYGPQIAGNILVASKPCAGFSTGALDYTSVLGGNGNLTYLWNNGATNQSINNISAGNYSVTVADSKNCQYQTSLDLKENPIPTASFGGSKSICLGSSAMLTINLSGSKPWNVTYTDGTTPIVINGINTSPYSFNVTPTVTTTYSITSVSDANCNGTDFGNSVTLTVNPIPVVTLTVPSTICIDANPITLTGGSPYGGLYGGIGVTGVVFDPMSSGIGTQTIKYTYVDNNGCYNFATAPITVNEVPNVSASTSGRTNYCEKEVISTLLNAFPLNAALYQWRLNGWFVKIYVFSL